MDWFGKGGGYESEQAVVAGPGAAVAGLPRPHCLIAGAPDWRLASAGPPDWLRFLKRAALPAFQNQLQVLSRRINWLKSIREWQSEFVGTLTGALGAAASLMVLLGAVHCSFHVALHSWPSTRTPFYSCPAIPNHSRSNILCSL